MKKIFTGIVFLILLLINNTTIYAKTTEKVVNKYKAPTLTAADVSNINKFVETHAKLIPYIEEKGKIAGIGCSYLNTKSLRVSDIFSAKMIINGVKGDTITAEDSKNDVDAEALFAFGDNKDTACDKDIKKYIKGASMFKDFIKFAKTGEVSTVSKMIKTIYIDTGDKIMDLFIAKGLWLNVQVAEGMYSPVLVSYLKMTGQDTSQFYIAQGNSNTDKYDIFTGPLYGCYLTAQTKSAMKTCLNTFVTTIKDTVKFSTPKIKTALKSPKY